MLEFASQCPYDLLLRLDTPVPAVAAFGAVDCGDQVMVGLNVYLFGDEATATAAREKPLWDAWFQERFPMPTAYGDSVQRGRLRRRRALRMAIAQIATRGCGETQQRRL